MPDYRVSFFDSLTISHMFMLRRDLAEDEKIIIRDGIPIRVKKSGIDKILQKIRRTL